jgi:hypothetical protein
MLDMERGQLTYVGARIPARQAKEFARLAKSTFRSQSALLMLLISNALKTGDLDKAAEMVGAEVTTEGATDV